MNCHTRADLMNEEPFHVCLLLQCLKPGGAALVAAKSYYFGVGGGTREVRECLSQSPTLLVERSMEIEDPGSVQREILVLRRL